MPGRKDLTQNMGEKWRKSGLSRGSNLFISYRFLSLLAFHDGTPLINSVIYRLKEPLIPKTMGTPSTPFSFIPDLLPSPIGFCLSQSDCCHTEF